MSRHRTPSHPKVIRFSRHLTGQLMLRHMLLATVCALSATGAAAQGYVYERLGLMGPGYTDQGGRAYSGVAWANALNAAGQVAGGSAVFSADGRLRMGDQAWIYSQGITLPVGLVGAEYTYLDGSRASWAHAINDAGAVIGQSSRYVGASVYEVVWNAGQASWIFDQGVTQRIGLVGEGFTRSDGFARSDVDRLNKAGDVIGSSVRFHADIDSGRAAWLYRQGITRQIGLLGSGFVTARGGSYNRAQLINEAGQAVGDALRFSGNLDTGYATWIYSEGQTRQIGLTGTGYTRSDGWALSSAQQLNEAGQVVGSSERFSGGAASGRAAWIFSEGQTRQIGLTGAEYTTSVGYAFSEVRARNDNAALNEAGQAIGYSTRFRATARTQPNGQSAWLYSQGSTHRIGLTGDGFTRPTTGYEYSDAIALNANGQVIGTTRRNGSGLAAWMHSDGSTREIGLTGAGYTDDVNSGNSTPVALNDAGQVAGTSLWYIDSQRTSLDAWLYSEGVTRKIGVSDAFYTQSEVVGLNQAGQVIGQSQRTSRADGSVGFVGDTLAWFYDDDLDQTFALDFNSPTADVGYFNSKVLGLTDDGLVVGTFEVHSSVVNDWPTRALVATRAFVWSMESGMLDLSALTGEQPDPYRLDFSYLANSLRINEVGQIAGNGGQGAFLLTPVPEPESWAMLLAGLGLTRWVAIRRRRASLKPMAKWA